MVMAKTYFPDRGDIIWIDFTPHSGKEIMGMRPALVVSPKSYNKKVGLAILCPITSKVKGYPFEVELDEGLSVSGAILSDQVKSVDWRARKAKFACSAPKDAVQLALENIQALLWDD
ncbi:MAG: endoribonuclease MazF [Planctomycetes bacterium]|nr:endoribonuclease MazF [Planctomycetota bacterium]